MPVMRELGGGVVYLTNHWITKEMTPARFDAIAPLLKAQSYIEDVRWHKGERISHDFTGFRALYPPLVQKGRCLPDVQAAWLGTKMGVAEQQWIHVEPLKSDRIIAHRSPRYHQPEFPWSTIVKLFGRYLLVVGLQAEVDPVFTGCDYYTPKDFLELAQLIAGSKLFIGNQSSPHAIAEGLKHNTILEAGGPPDCHFRRPGAQIVHGDTVTIEWNGQLSEVTNPTRYYYTQNASCPIKAGRKSMSWERQSYRLGSMRGFGKTKSDDMATTLAAKPFVQEISEREFNAGHLSP